MRLGAIYNCTFDNFGPVLIVQKGPAIHEESPWSPAVPPGKVEAPTHGAISFEIAGDVLIKSALLVVLNDVEGAQYPYAINSIGSTEIAGAYCSIHVLAEYYPSPAKRVFRAHLSNLSHTWGRNMQFRFDYTRGDKISIADFYKSASIVSA